MATHLEASVDASLTTYSRQDFSEDEASIRRARTTLNLVRRQKWAATGVWGFRSSPLDRLPETILNDQVLRLLDERSLPTPNLLPGGDFENLDVARQAGWRHLQLVQAEAAYHVELSADSPRSGELCLRIFSDAEISDSIAVEPLVWLASPVVPLERGDVIRVTGWVRGDPEVETPSWAFVEDSLGGPPLSLQIAASSQWRHFVIYRATEEHHLWNLRLAASGPGDVFFDGLVVQRVPREYVGQQDR
jgi:hypothetical protein